MDNIKWVDISEKWNNPGKSDMTFVDCFCGAGGLSKGLELAGLKGICGLDFFKEAGMTYQRNFEHPFVFGDIKEQETKEHFYEVVSKELGKIEGGHKYVDIVAGGFPCQGFSLAGNRVVDDPRNSLYKELLEIVRTLKPNYVLCENVKGLRSMLGGKIEEKIISDFKEIGYEMHAEILLAADYCVPQKRERIIFIGNRIGKNICYPKPILSPSEYVTVGEAIGDLIGVPENKELSQVYTRHTSEMEKKIAEVQEGYSIYGYLESGRKLIWNESSFTMKVNHGTIALHPRLPRVITPREMARLQSFPDDFIFEGSKTKQLVQIGNAVPPLLGKALGLAIRESASDL